MRTLATSNCSLEQTRAGECVLRLIPLIGAKTCPVGDLLALSQVAALLYHRNQIATVRIRCEHRLEMPIKYRFIHTVCDISTIANVDCGLARTVRQPFEEAANLIRAGVVYLVSFPAGGAFAARPE